MNRKQNLITLILFSGIISLLAVTGCTGGTSSRYQISSHTVSDVDPKSRSTTERHIVIKTNTDTGETWELKYDIGHMRDVWEPILN